jgi:hypothetical protein
MTDRTTVENDMTAFVDLISTALLYMVRRALVILRGLHK